MNNYDPLEHYQMNTGPCQEYADLAETPVNIKNVGWSLGNYCPFNCRHCYSKSARLHGREITKFIIDRVVARLTAFGVETVNLGGNEPWFTNGKKDTLLPYTIEKLTQSGIKVGVTTSGITVCYLYEYYPEVLKMLNDVDVSLDSPHQEEHDANRGGKVYTYAIKALEICRREGIPHSIIMTAMNWNFTHSHIDQLLQLAYSYEANVRINTLRPIEPQHMRVALPPEMYFAGFAYLMDSCDSIELGDPPLTALTSAHTRRCPCGRTSFRIHSITPDGKIYVSPCIYLHDYKVPLDLLEHELTDIVQAPQFRVFRQRHANPDKIDGCTDCTLLTMCGGGCAARAYLYHLHQTGIRTMLAQDPYCPAKMEMAVEFPQQPVLSQNQQLVHMDYLCTWIGKPR